MDCVAGGTDNKIKIDSILARREWKYKILTSPSTVMLSVPICCATLMASRNSSGWARKATKQISNWPKVCNYDNHYSSSLYTKFVCDYDRSIGHRSGQR